MVVLTHRPAEPVLGITFAGDLHTAVAEAKAGDRYVNVLGAKVAARCVEGAPRRGACRPGAGAPRDGMRLFDHPGGTRVRLEPIDDEYPHWYRVAR